MATVLLVEPNVQFRRMMEQELRKAGHEVFGADDAFIASRALRERELDLVVIEMVIPGDITAADLLVGLRDDPPPGEPARLAMTAQAHFASQEAFFRAEYQLDGFLLKPFLPAKLRVAVDEALASRERRRNAAPKMSEWTTPGGFAPPPLDASVLNPPPPPDPVPDRSLAIPEPPPPAALAAPAPLPEVPLGVAEDVLELETGDLVPLETNPGLVNAPAPSASEFEAASAEQPISLEDLAPPPSSVERRAVKRFPVRIPVALHDGKAPFRARSENLGRGGIFVVTDRAFERGAKLRVRLELPVAGEGANEISVHVAHGTEVASMKGVGLRFDDMSAETARRLDKFLEDLQAPAQSRPFLVVASQSLSAEVERIAQSYRGEEMRVRLVTAAENVQDVAESDPPDLMLLDLADLVMIAFVGALKATRATSGIPIALIDRSGQAKSALLAAAAGADRFVSLPGELMPLIGFSVEKLAASRRRGVRVRFQRPVSIWIAGAQTDAAAMDLSETGMQVRIAVDVPEQTNVEAAIALSDGGPPVRVHARVAWKSPASDAGTLGIRLGLIFEIDEATRARLREEVRRALAASYYVRWLAAAPTTLKNPVLAKQL